MTKLIPSQISGIISDDKIIVKDDDTTFREAQPSDFPTIPVQNFTQNLWTTTSMSWTTLIHTDVFSTVDSIITRTADWVTNGFITVTPMSWQIDFTSTATETVSFTYLITKA